MHQAQQNSPSAGCWHVGEETQALAAHERLVHWVVRRQCLGGLRYVEAVQAGRIALWRALRGYDPQRGNRFSSYAVPAIAHAVWRAVGLERRAASAPGAAPCLDPPELEAVFERELVDAALHDLVVRLPSHLAMVIVAHYGLGDQDPQTFGAIGQRLGITRQRVQQLHVEALLWLADPAHSVSLRRRLDRNTIPDYRAYLARRRAWEAARRGTR
jgi:RNA polymerase sigma factor (sigma-70 family)